MTMSSYFLRTEHFLGVNCKRNEAVSSQGKRDRDLNAANIPAGGYSAMSLHGAPLLCLTFENKT